MKAVHRFICYCLSHIKTGLMLALLCMFGLAQAHSSSNSFLTLSADNTQLTLRADVNLRDVDLIFN
ncbi:MAG: hypothetical protein RL659_1727, partial [Pseudomonadota bacterium]